MATYFTSDFADFGSDWTERWNTAGTFSVTSGDLDVPTGVSADWRHLSWNDIDGDADRDDVEVLVKFTSPSSLGTAIHPIALRGAGGDETATNYSVRLSTSTFRIYYCNAADTPVQVATVSGTWSTSTVYWCRFRVNGTTIRARIWADGGGEPGTWDIDTTDATIAGVGWVSLGQYAGGAAYTVQQIGVGTNGDTAPSSAGAATGTLSATLADATLSAAGTLAITGTTSATLADLTSAATGTLAIVGTTTQTLADVTLVAEGSLAAQGSGTVAATLADVTLSSAGTLAITGTTAQTLADLTSAATGALAITGATAKTLDALTLAATGQLGSFISGTLTATLADVTLSAAGEVDIAAALGVTLGDLTLSAAGRLALTGALSKTLADLTLAASGSADDVLTGTLAQALADCTLIARIGERVLSAPPIGHSNMRLRQRPDNLSTRTR